VDAGVAVILGVGDEEFAVDTAVAVVPWVGDEEFVVAAAVAVVPWVGDEEADLDDAVLCDVYSKIPASTTAIRMTTPTTARMAMMRFFPWRGCWGCRGGKFDSPFGYVAGGNCVPSAAYVGEEGVLPVG